MILDFNQLTLSYRVNEGSCFQRTITNGTYVAGMTFSNKDVEMELVSYQRVVGGVFELKK